MMPEGAAKLGVDGAARIKKVSSRRNKTALSQ
jgi:hypothetical protein